jgi:hypothetical protein
MIVPRTISTDGRIGCGSTKSRLCHRVDPIDVITSRGQVEAQRGNVTDGRRPRLWKTRHMTLALRHVTGTKQSPSASTPTGACRPMLVDSDNRDYSLGL